MQSLTRLTIFLCCAWAASLFYGEMVAYRIPLWACSWPQPYSSSPSGRRMDRKSNASDQINVAVLADPQLMDRTSLRLPPRSLALEAAQFYTDLYMRRSFIASILPFRPDLILFLGDQFDGGPFLSDLEWQGSLNRFKHIFELSDDGRISGIQVYYLSGNHDIGYSRFHSLYPEVVNRFEKEFGVRNYHFNIQNVEFVAVDAQTLDGPIQGNLTSLSWDFIKNMSKDVTLNPRVLLTHIPLHRPDGTPCGPSRSSDIINQRVSRAGPDKGIIYQNYLSEETSRQLLKLIRPVLVLSGHDHDQCTVTHTTSDGTVIEHTLGTLSWQQGNLYPSFMLLSVASLESSSSSNRGLVSTHLCFLPMQTHIYIWYLALFVATLLLLIFWPTNGFGSWNHCWHWMSYNGGTRRGNYTVASKEKDEDEHCDYEMVWDAEGSMHLVKRASVKISVTTSNDTGLMGRGGVVARPTVKKNSTPEIEAAIEMTTDVKFDDTGKGLKFSKLKARKILQRLIRVIRLLVIIASVNVPLYMMLLFKDSIEER